MTPKRGIFGHFGSKTARRGSGTGNGCAKILKQARALPLGLEELVVTDGSQFGLPVRELDRNMGFSDTLDRTRPAGGPKRETAVAKFRNWQEHFPWG